MQRLVIAALFLIFVATEALCAQTKPVALTGTLVTPDQLIPDGTLLIRDGRIVAAGNRVTLPAGTRVVATHGIIAPGLVDLHNHLTWNIFPRWKPIEEFANRYEWQQKPIYQVLMTAPHQAIVEEDMECPAERYAEVKALTQGETSVVGSLHGECNHGLARNLDDDAALHETAADYDVFPLVMSDAAVAAAKATLSKRGALLVHLAEGAPTDAASRREFSQFKSRGLLLPGVSLIHGVALQPADFAEMAKSGVGLVWSPRSNLELYGATANVAAAKAAGVTLALAPDWSPTGSVGLLDELNYAATWNATQTPKQFTDRELVLMATKNAAELSGFGKEIGSLASGFVADVLVIRGSIRGSETSSRKDAYWSLIHSTAADVALVLVGGEALYGDPVLMEELSPPGKLETLQICGNEKRVAFTGDAPGRRSFVETEKQLNRFLTEWSTHLAPIAECANLSADQ